MRILALCQGHYGERIIEHIRRTGPQDWVIEVFRPPRALPVIIDDPAEFLPSKMPQADLFLVLSESPETAQLVPAIAKLSGVSAVVMPVDNSAWLPLGLKNQIKNDLDKIGIAAVFPKTFCTLTEKTAGFGADIETYDSAQVASFAKYFGMPRLKIKIDAQQITEVKIERSAPCGSTHCLAEKLVGLPIGDAVPQAGLFVHHHPCLASMAMEPTGETLMHISGYVVNDEVSRQLKLFRKP